MWTGILVGIGIGVVLVVGFIGLSWLSFISRGSWW